MALAEDNLDILFAAITVTGQREEFEEGLETDAEYTERVTENAKLVTLLGQAGSRPMRVIDAISGATVYPANIEKVDFEEKSQRPLVTLGVKTSKYSKDGKEQIRGLRVDEPGGQDLYEELKEHKGRRVLIYKVMEDSDRSEGKGFKNIYAIRDLGKAEDFS